MADSRKAGATKSRTPSKKAARARATTAPSASDTTLDIGTGLALAGASEALNATRDDGPEYTIVSRDDEALIFGDGPELAAGGPPPITWRFLEREYWTPERLQVPDYQTARKIDDLAFQELKRGIEVFGLAGGIDARAEDGLTIGGNQRTRACRELIAEHAGDLEKLRAMNLPEGRIPVNPIAGMPDAIAALFNIRLNNRETQGDFHMPGLAQLVSELDAAGHDATLAGFSAERLEEILTFSAEPTELKEEKDGTDVSVPRVARTRRGEFWQLGRHRLLCADSTDPRAWEILLAGGGPGEPRDERPLMLDGVFTDPPYGVAYEGGTEEKLTIQNDDLDEAALEQLLTAALGHAHTHTRPGGAWYVFAPGGPLFQVFGTVIKRLGVWRETIIWVKDRFVLSRQDYHWRHEPAFAGEKAAPDEPRPEIPEKMRKQAEATHGAEIIYGWREGARHWFIDDRTQDTFWHVERPSRSAEHPTMKPVELYRRGYRNSSKPLARWGEPFAGSGGTFIAGEQTGRTIYGIELDPRFVDVCIKRWEQFSGGKAILLSTHPELAPEGPQGATSGQGSDADQVEKEERAEDRGSMMLPGAGSLALVPEAGE